MCKCRGERGLYNRFCKRFFAAVIIRLTAQSDSRAPENDKTSKKGFLWNGSDGVDHVAREVLQHGVANRGSRIYIW